MKTALPAEKQGLEKLWKDLKAKHIALSKAESARKRRSKKKKTQERFFRDPFQFARTLFEQPKSGTLTVDKDVLQQHLRNTYSDPQSEAPLNIQGLVEPANPVQRQAINFGGNKESGSQSQSQISTRPERNTIPPV